MVKKSSLIDGFVYLFIGILTCFLIFSFDYKDADALVVFFFIINGIYFFCGIVFCKKNISLKRLFYIFNYVFMFIAPLNQYCSGTVFWKSHGLRITYSNLDYLFANMLILVFCILFDLVYHRKGSVQHAHSKSTHMHETTYNGILLTDIISLIAFAILFVSNNIFARQSFTTENANFGTQLVNILKGIPIATFSFQIIYWKQNIRQKKILIILPAVEILVIYFPFSDSISRFLLFGAYLTIVSIIFNNVKYKSLYPLLFVLGFGFVFSAFNFFKWHGLSEISNFSLSVVNFNHVDYDAYQLLMATVYYARHYGVCYGINLLSAVFGFIPRSIWHGKAFPSGSIVIGALGSWFTNVSCPWIAEWYYAFGIVGVLLGAIVSGVVFRMVDSHYNDQNSALMRGAFAVLTGFSIYILRGAILPTWNYTFAVILSFVAIDFAIKFSQTIKFRKWSTTNHG